MLRNVFGALDFQPQAGDTYVLTLNPAGGGEPRTISGIVSEVDTTNGEITLDAGAEASITVTAAGSGCQS